MWAIGSRSFLESFHSSKMKVREVFGKSVCLHEKYYIACGKVMINSILCGGIVLYLKQIGHFLPKLSSLVQVSEMKDAQSPS